MNGLGVVETACPRCSEQTNILSTLAVIYPIVIKALEIYNVRSSRPGMGKTIANNKQAYFSYIPTR